MSNTHYTIPNRTGQVDDLIYLIAFNLKAWTNGDKTPEMGNLILSMCEVAVNLPLEWFANEERSLILAGIQEIYKNDPTVFIKDIADGSVSFYGKFCSEENLLTQSRDKIVRRLKDLHREQYGD